MRPVGQQFEQLAMLMPASQIKDRIPHSYDQKEFMRNGKRELESVGQMWNRKSIEAEAPATLQPTDVQWIGGKGVRVPVGDPVPNGAHGAGLLDSMAANGYKGDPVPITHSGVWSEQDYADEPNPIRLTDGHHRVAAADDLKLEVPVMHSDDKSSEIKRQAMVSRANGAQFHDVRMGSAQRAEGPLDSSAPYTYGLKRALDQPSRPKPDFV